MQELLKDVNQIQSSLQLADESFNVCGWEWAHKMMIEEVDVLPTWAVVTCGGPVLEEECGIKGLPCVLSESFGRWLCLDGCLAKSCITCATNI